MIIAIAYCIFWISQYKHTTSANSFNAVASRIRVQKISSYFEAR